jgi:hypothetical protein
MLLPKRVKYRRVQRGRMTGKAMRGNTVSYGEYGLQALEPGMDQEQPDRGCPYRHDPLHQARRSGLDQDFPRQARHTESLPTPAWVPARAMWSIGSQL